MPAVWLVRHGATTAPAGVAVGSTDAPLSDAGRDQVRRLAADLAARPLARIFSSDRVRAIATAEAIAAIHGLRVAVDRRLREIDFGDWEGRSLEDLWRDEPEAAIAWERDLRATPPAFGETFAQLEARVLAFWSESGLPSTGEVAVVAHRGSLAILHATIAGHSLEGAFAAGLGLGETIRVRGRLAPPSHRMDC